jgi:hypothetical protein
MPRPAQWLRLTHERLGDIPVYRFVPVDYFSKTELRRLPQTEALKAALKALRAHRKAQTPPSV